MDIAIKGWTFTHWWVRPVVKVWFDIYQKSVTYSGTEHIDWGKPIIFAASHQSAFTDALCLILPTPYVNDRFIYPLTRADAFGKNKATDWILTAFHMLPVYRPKDKVDIKKQNDSIFSHCYDILSKNRNLLIHPEGNCFAIKRVRRFKKGLARIALGAESKNDFKLDVSIIPVGINYRKITEPRSGIHIQFGEPISVSNYQHSYQEQEAQAISEMTGEVERKVKKVTVDIPSKKYYKLTQEVINLAKKSTTGFDREAPYSKEEVEFEKEIIEGLKNLESENSESTSSTEKSVKEIHSILRRNGLSSGNSLLEQYSIARIIAEGMGYGLISPMFLYGWINNALPWFLMHRLADRIKDTQFISSARMASGLFFFPFFYLVQAALVFSYTSSWVWTIAYILSVPFAGILSLNISEKWKEWMQQLRLKLMPKKAKSDLHNLIKKVMGKLSVDTATKPLSNATEP